MPSSDRTRRRRPPVPARARRRAGETFHDLRNHIHGIAMTVQLALDDSALLPEPHRRYLHEIHCKCRQLARLTQHLGDLAHLRTSYAVVCTHCRRTILDVPHLGRTEEQLVAEHVRKSHPELG